MNETANTLQATRTKLGTSHRGNYSYWMDSKDLYVYQKNEFTGVWIGWYASFGAWENRMNRILE